MLFTASPLVKIKKAALTELKGFPVGKIKIWGLVLQGNPPGARTREVRAITRPLSSGRARPRRVSHSASTGPHGGRAHGYGFITTSHTRLRDTY